MASPVDKGRVATNISTAASPLVVSLVTSPSTPSVGDLMIMVVRANNPTSVTVPSGWTNCSGSPFSVVSTELDDNIILICWKEWAGTEGTSVNVTVGASAKASAIVWCISDAEDPTTQPPELSTHAFATVSSPSASVNPTAVTPTGGSKDYLFLFIGGNQGETTSPPGAAASGYSNLVGANSGTGGSTTSNNRAFGCSKQATASSEDPAAITISSAESWSAWTMAIHPAATGPVEYTDSATITVDIQVSSTELAEFVDSATALVTIQASGVEGKEFVDTAELYVDIQASGTELREVTDTATVLVDIQVISVEVAEFVDAATVYVDILPSGTEVREVFDSATVYIDLQASGTEVREVTDAATVPFTITTSGVETLERSDSATVYIDIQSSGTDIHTVPTSAPSFVRKPIIVGSVIHQDRSRW